MRRPTGLRITSNVGELRCSSTPPLSCRAVVEEPSHCRTGRGARPAPPRVVGRSPRRVAVDRSVPCTSSCSRAATAPAAARSPFADAKGRSVSRIGANAALGTFSEANGAFAARPGRGGRAARSAARPGRQRLAVLLRQPHRELRPPRPAAHLHRSTVRGHHRVDDRQAQPGAAVVPRPRDRSSSEPLEHVRQQLRGDARAGVDDGEPHLTVAAAEADRDRRARRGVVRALASRFVGTWLSREASPVTTTGSSGRSSCQRWSIPAA